MFIFKRLHEIAIEGMSFKNIGDIYESGEIKVLEYLKKENEEKNVLIFDVGANVGQYQAAIIESFKPHSNFIIHSFEPSLLTYQKLNKYKIENIYNWQLGLGDAIEKKTLFQDHINSPLSSLYKKTKNGYYKVAEMDYSEEIEITTLDQFCEQNNIKEIDFLKIDVEGHELFVLNGGINMLNMDKIKMIQFEFGPANIDSHTYFKNFYNLLSEKFNIYRIVKRGIIPINSYFETDEVFLPCNYLAVHKSKSNNILTFFNGNR
ncbi:MAG: FkbM family methyltransferase [Bacteroidia bacterium]|nr:FkbM family methyltransferase [Bacteroidia bacterium]